MGVFRHRNVSRTRRLRSRWIPTKSPITTETIDNVSVATLSLNVLTEATAETISNSAASTQTLVEKTAETITNFEARTNFLLNGGFETNLNSTSPFGTNTRDTTEHKFGTASAKSVWITAGPPWEWGIAAAGVGTFLAGRTLTGSAYVKGTGTSIGKNVDMQLRDGVGNHSNDNNLILTGDWQRLSATWTIPIDETIAVWIFGADAGVTTGDTMFIDGMQLEIGSSPTDYIETDGAPVTSGGKPWSIQTITDAPAETTNSSGSGSSTTTEATAETISNSATSTQIITDVLPEPPGTSTGTGSQNLTEKIAEFVSNGGTNTPSIDEVITMVARGQVSWASLEIPVPAAIADDLTNIGTAAFAINESEAGSEGGSGSGDPALSEEIAETISNAAISSFTIVEAIAETDSNSGAATILISDFQTEEEINTGSGSPTISESLAEGIVNSGTGSQNLDEQSPEINLTSVALSTQSLGEAVSETITSSSSSTQTFVEASADSPQNSSTNIPTLIDLETDTPVNTGTGSHFTDSEKIAEMDIVTFLASQIIDEQRDIVVVPFSDISTGTWTVDPLYEKVDELIVAAGYPTETIRSGNNPSNDTAILGLQPVSDPGIDDNHFINVEFYKDGSEVLDFTVNLKEGSTLIATRTFTDVQETESVPRRERIVLSNGEASGITDYSNLNIELIANQTS